MREQETARSQKRLDAAVCLVQVETYTKVLVRIEAAAAQAFLADDMRVATALRALAVDLRLELDPLAARLTAHARKNTP